MIALTHSLLGVDPLFDGGLLWTPLLIVVLKVLVVFVIGLVATMLMVWFERKAIAGMQNRIGPNKAGPFGLLQTLADGIKLFFKEDLLPERSDRLVFRLAPYLSFVPAFLAVRSSIDSTPISAPSCSANSVAIIQSGREVPRAVIF